VRFNKKLFSHSCHEFKPRAVRAQALAAVACGGACASVFWFDSSLGRNYFSPHRFRPCDATRPQFTTGAYGFGFQLGRPDEARTYGHGGGAPGMNAILRVYPESGQSVIVLCNLDSPSASRMGDWLLARMPLK